MTKTLGLLLAVFLILSACIIAVGAAKPENPGKPDDVGRPENIPPESTDGNPAPESITLPTDQADDTPAAGHAPDTITEDGPGIDWNPIP